MPTQEGTKIIFTPKERNDMLLAAFNNKHAGESQKCADFLTNLGLSGHAIKIVFVGISTSFIAKDGRAMTIDGN